MEIEMKDLIVTLLVSLVVVAVAVGLVFGIVYLVLLLLKLIRNKQSEAVKFFLLMIICVLIMAASWVLNMGWCRLVLTFFAVPFIHAVVFIFINTKVLLKLDTSWKLKLYTLLVYITYLLTYLCFPDGGDITEAYVLFGIIHNSFVANIFGVVSVVCLIAHIVFTVLQIVETRRIKQN